MRVGVLGVRVGVLGVRVGVMGVRVGGRGGGLGGRGGASLILSLMLPLIRLILPPWLLGRGLSWVGIGALKLG